MGSGGGASARVRPSTTVSTTAAAITGPATAQTGQRDADGTERLNRWFAGYAGRYTIVVLREDDGSAAASFAEIVSFLKKSGNLL